ncbi:hypothetical protein DY120_07345 [Apilactobacillus micheneri]|uniref:Uncharacterized protein n=1 Tax=Apilactobacillus micheneri TaxID=1899430 RepID=A0ABY2YZG7_9LACO|nr:hypothetical protein [Apilactobacillus micheneri]TPR23113.1 hypothetical protein DY114_07330 [Apilactobacillus micheneri]TPR24431.1 hypothetical protein DY111_07345 [Apilactobacillus micheneri]TPR29378.1 hypothetical protein DY120_07345 [Apilactobacillus micheneri]TPR34585.1 hypothetical protein DY027_07335 [Apilactobacillus micheneri]
MKVNYKKYPELKAETYFNLNGLFDIMPVALKENHPHVAIITLKKLNQIMDDYDYLKTQSAIDKYNNFVRLTKEIFGDECVANV